MGLSFGSILSTISDFIPRCSKLIVKWFNTFKRRQLERTLINRLKVIILGFEDILAESKTCSLVYILRKIQNTSCSDILDEKIKRMYLLREWYDFFRFRVETSNGYQIAGLIREFIIILVRISNITEESVKLIDQRIRLDMKNDSYSWPLFKDIFSSAAKDISKLSRGNEAKLIGISEWSPISLPDL